jgi:hypothetical protein
MKKDNIDNMFEFDEKAIKNTLRKAKLYSTLKIIGISVIVSGIVLVGVSRVSNRIVNKAASNRYDQEYTFKQITGANEYMSGSNYNHGLFSGEAEYSTYKLIGNKPVYNGTYVFDYSIFPSMNDRHGSQSRSISIAKQNDSDSSDEFDYYNQLGQKYMLLYHPKINYKSYNNELGSLGNMNENKSMEIALSFDKEYTVKEVKNMIPKNINLSWYWVDTENEESLEYLKRDAIFTDTAYGIDAIDKMGRIVKDPEMEFIQNIEYVVTQKSIYQSEYIRRYNILKGKDEKLGREDIKVIGVVVTGNAKDLKFLQNKDYIKGSTIGVVVD